MNMWVNFLSAGLVLFFLVTGMWIISLLHKDASIMDLFWGLGFVFLVWHFFYFSEAGYLPRKLLLGMLVTIWGLRLSLYILWRNLGKQEDFRYQKWRRDHGRNWWWRSYLQVFLLQGFLIWVLSTPLLVVQFNSQPDQFTFIDFLGTILWVVGFGFEAVGDWQLARFKAQPQNQGKVLRSGLWRYTRHPNYFGDALLWWGYGFFAFGVPSGYLTLYSPLLMTFLLLRVSGVRLLEKSLTEQKPGYEVYIHETSAFFPWFPRKIKSED